MLALPHLASGKVREIYEVDADHLLFVATDRISAYDVILNQPIPDKGRVLTGLSLHFFDLLDTPNHFVSTDLRGVEPLTEEQRAELAGRAMLVRRARVVPVECVVRGYLYGSSWAEYQKGGGPTTEHLPPGLQLADAAGADIHPGDQGRERPRREPHRGRGTPDPRRRPYESSAPAASTSTGGPPSTPGRVA